MIFSEIYGAYFQAVAAVLKEAVKGTLDERKARRIVQRIAYVESSPVIIDALKTKEWPLVDSEWGTNLEHEPTRPLTKLEKQWLKAISMDPRFQLFGLTFEGLDDVEPLFVPEDFIFFDRYDDGDPYESLAYQAYFRIVLEALAGGTLLEVTYKGKSGKRRVLTVEPVKLEYSEKDDKFRLIANSRKDRLVLNMARIENCCFSKVEKEEIWPIRGQGETVMDEVILELVDERNALERALLHFAHFEREAEKLDEKHYRLKIRYDKEDVTEMLIRVLAFGPMIKVVEPDTFVEQIKGRLQRQKKMEWKH